MVIDERSPASDEVGELRQIREIHDVAPCGYLSLLLDGTIVRANGTVRGWTGLAAGATARFQALLTNPGRLLFETHCVPLLRLQGFVNEVSLDLVDHEGKPMPVLLGATAVRDAAGALDRLLVVLFNAPTRREYERELVRMRRAAEEATDQVQIQRALAERKVAEQAALLHSVGRMAAGDLETPITIEFDSSLLPLASELERLRRDILGQIQTLKERNEEIQQLNRELRRQIEQRSLLLVDSVVARGGLRAAGEVGMLPPGTLLADRYRLGAVLGQGGMATVYEAERMTDGRRLAAKVLSVRPNYQALTRFAREAQLLARLEHPNLINIIDTDVTADRTAYIVMEQVRGKSLAEHAARYGDLAFVLPVLAQVADALAAVHAADVVHRDLKPSNVLITEDAGTHAVHARLVDFGISLLLDPESPSSEQRSATPPSPAEPDPKPSDAPLNPLSPTVLTNLAQFERDAGLLSPTQVVPPPEPRQRRSSEELTQAGALLGTPSYMAPELSTGSSLAQPASDLFSFGVLAYQVLTGKLPFTEPPLLVALLHDGALPFEPLDRACPGLDGALTQVLERCLSADPAARPTAGRLLASLTAAQRTAGP